MDKVTLTLSAQTYNVIVKAVQELPWRLANPVFQEIDPQVHAALVKESQDAAKPASKDESP